MLFSIRNRTVARPWKRSLKCREPASSLRCSCSDAPARVRRQRRLTAPRPLRQTPSAYEDVRPTDWVSRDQGCSRWMRMPVDRRIQARRNLPQPIDATPPPPCESGSQECSGDHIVQCLDGEWVTVEPPCDFGCQGGAVATSAGPAPRRASTSRLGSAMRTGRGWSTLTTCDFCLSNGTCADGTCEGDETYCADAELLVEVLGWLPVQGAYLRLWMRRAAGGMSSMRPRVPSRCRPQVWADGTWSGRYLLLRCNEDGSSYEDIVEGSCDDCWCVATGRDHVRREGRRKALVFMRDM